MGRARRYMSDGLPRAGWRRGRPGVAAIRPRFNQPNVPTNTNLYHRTLTRLIKMVSELYDIRLEPQSLLNVVVNQIIAELPHGLECPPLDALYLH